MFCRPPKRKLLYLCKEEEVNPDCSSVLLFCKCFDVDKQKLTWLGALVMPKTATLEATAKKVIQGQPATPHAWTLLEEWAPKRGRVDKLKLADTRTLQECGFQTGDILVFQKNYTAEKDATFAANYLTHLAERKTQTERLAIGLPVPRLADAYRPVVLQRPSSACLRSAFGSTEFADVVFTCGESKLFAHKIILSQLEYFKRMFGGGFAETKQQQQQQQSHVATEIPVEEGVLQDMRKLLSFHYGHSVTLPPRVPSSVAQLCEFVLLGDRYLCDDLRKEGVAELHRHVSIDTCLDVLMLADKLDDKSLKQTCMDLIATNPAEVAQQPEFKHICQQIPDLVSEMFQQHKSAAAAGRHRFRRSRSRSPHTKRRASRSRSRSNSPTSSSSSSPSPA